MPIDSEFAKIRPQILRISENNFEEIALAVYRLQTKHIPIYRQFQELLKIKADQVNLVSQIPFLPIQFFKTNKICVAGANEEAVFQSSGTTDAQLSRHFVNDLELYKKSCLQGFEHFFGPINHHHLLALLPSYLERSNSSLVYMTKYLMQCSGQDSEDFYLHDFAKLESRILELRASGRKLVLLGVSYALLDFAEQLSQEFPDLIVIETGGMKGRRREMIREELHKLLQQGFGTVAAICSEYGMTELLSQSYSLGLGRFQSPPWKRVFIRDVQDPLKQLATKATGALNIIDLANLYSCSFIATDDLGKKAEDGSFEVLGRLDHSDIRGCNLML